MRNVACLASSFLGLIGSGLALPSLAGLSGLERRADPSKAGYLAVYWKTANETVYFSLSANENPLDFEPINSDNPVIIPTVGTTAIRDTSIVPGGGDEAGQKYYIIGTDLNIEDTTWDASSRTGSRGIFVWESTDLITWTDQRLVTVEGDTAGMVWAPDAVWDPSTSSYFVHWASKFYSEDDTAHSGDPTTSLILRYAHTSDFKTFTEPQTYIDYNPTDVLDLSFLTVGNNTFIRYYAEGGGPVAEISTTGLLGTWTRPAGIIATPYEGPYPFWDNAVDGKAYLLTDYVGGSAGIRAFYTTDIMSGEFTQDTSSNLTWMRHLSVLPVTQTQYDALAAM